MGMLRKKLLFFFIFYSLFLIGITTEEQQRITDFEKDVAQKNCPALTHFEYGNFLAHIDEKEYYATAFKQLQLACTMQPQNIQWQFSFAAFACRIGRIQDSLDAYKTILEKHPQHLQVLYNAGFALKVGGKTELAQKIYQHILSSKPEYEPAHLGLAFAYLSLGKYYDGWKEHIWNLKKQNKYSPELMEFIQNGTLTGKRILLIPEGGLGDYLHFIRYAQRLKLLGAHVIATVPPLLMPLIKECPFIDELFPLKSAIPPHDARVTVMSLATHFGDTELSLPHNIPYIFPPAERIAFWKQQLQSDTRFKIGICWQPDVHNDVSRLPIARRGIPLLLLCSIGALPHVSLYSLQKIEGLDQLKLVPSHIKIHTFDDQFDVTHGSFVDTASVMNSLDLIISTDTATAHVAGAMGKRVWLLLPFNTDWRWLNNRLDSPWYPTMRIFKQPEPFNWEPVVEEISSLLRTILD